MFVNFKCGECESTMNLHFSKFVERVRYDRNSQIRCQACGASFPNNVAFELNEFLSTYHASGTQWTVEFTVPKNERT